MRITPINMAEAVFEPFWAPDLSGLPHWTIEPVGETPREGSPDQFRSGQRWVYETGRATRLAGVSKLVFRGVRMGASAALRSGPAHVPRHRHRCQGYDKLLMSAVMPEGALTRIIASTDLGDRTLHAPPAGKLKQEYVLPLDGARRLESSGDRGGRARRWCCHGLAQLAGAAKHHAARPIP